MDDNVLKAFAMFFGGVALLAIEVVVIWLYVTLTVPYVPKEDR